MKQAPAEIDEHVFRARVGEGMSSTKLAEEFGVSRSAIMRRANKLNVDVFGNKKRVLNTVRAEIADMTMSDAIEYLLEVVAYLSAAHDEDRIARVLSHGFAPLEAKVLLVVFSEGVVARERVSDALYAHRSDVPVSKIIDVYVSKIRKKLAEKGWPVEIRTVWGYGYEGVRLDADFRFPWELN